MLDKQTVPTVVKYCKKCVISNQRPRITLDAEGVCSACNFAYQKEHTIDWQKREQQLVDLCKEYRRDDGSYDVLVPCSGGKDASYVAHILKTEYNMHPLTVTFAPFEYTDIGWQNYQNFIKAGFANLLCWPNGEVHRKLSRIAFAEVGDNFLPFIFGQMSYPFHIAEKFGIKLVFYGENGEAEYGGSTKNNEKPFMPVEDWAEMYWKGNTVDDLVQWGDIECDESDLYFYKPPASIDAQMHWMSYYRKWVPQDNYYYAAEHTGFKPNVMRSNGTYSKYASLDDAMDDVHYYMAYIKFGLGRTTSDAAHEIRDGHITREEGIALVRRYDGEFPYKNLKAFLDYVDMTESEFKEVVDSFRPAHLWENQDGLWRLKHQVE